MHLPGYTLESLLWFIRCLYAYKKKKDDAILKLHMIWKKFLLQNVSPDFSYFKLNID